MLKRYVSFSFGLIAAGCVASAQGAGTSAFQPASSGSAAQFGGSAPSSGIFESNTFLEAANRVFDPTSDSMNFEEGSFVWKGRSFNLTEQRAFRARFERFLLASPTEQEREYALLMSDILERLSVENNSTDEAIFETWELLFRASQFDVDGGNSIIVANQVFNAWRIRKESRGMAMSQRELEQLRVTQQEIVANREFVLRRLREARTRETRRENEERGSEGNTDTGLMSEDAFRVLDLAETEAKIVAMETQSAATALQAKLQFQSQIVSFMMQRRFQHALVLSSFYQVIFKGSHQQLEVGKEELLAFFPNTDLTFTVDTMAFVSREAVNDIKKGVDAVNTAYAEERPVIALERLQETFFLGEYSPELNFIPTGQRRHLLDLYRGMIEAGELAEAKDYNGVAELVEQISALAADFPRARILSSLDTAKSMSNMAVFAAAQYRNLGDVDKAREELQTAIEIWPSNPAIHAFQQETTKLATASSQGVQVFDDLISRQDTRAIFERRLELGFALADDEERRPLLMEIIDQVSQIELLIKQSEELVKQGNQYAAWELLIEAAKINADDAPMNRARAELAPQVADFVVHLNRADKQMESGEYAGALAGYLAAQDVYPASRLCRQGIDSTSAALMASLKSGTGE
ncbi:MAG: tetratricopeptide repeat protein [Lentimonas sp.]